MIHKKIKMYIFSLSILGGCANSANKVAAGLPTTANEPQYPSKASHAVILIKVD